MDPIKIIIFVGAFLLLLILGRKLSGSGLGSDLSGLSPEGYPPEPVPSIVASPLNSSEEESGRKPVLVGADLPFPISLPEIERNNDGKYNRPEFLNYYFEKTDLRYGPQDPTVFCDDFYLETRDVETAYPGLYKFLVATPDGLRQALTSERLPALYVDGQAIIVACWDIAAILDVAVKQIMKGYVEDHDKEANALPDEDTD